MMTDQEHPPLNRRLFSRFVPLGLVAALAGCDYSPPAEDRIVATGVYVDPNAAGPANRPGAPGRVLSDEEVKQKKDILDGALQLIQSSATTPGGNPFQQATKNLNQYFDSTSRAEFTLDRAAREYLLRQMPEQVVRGLEEPTFTNRDARHLEDCMLYSSIASRVAGTGDDLTRVARVFDWMVRQVQLIPPGSLSSPNLGPLYSRPFDVLLRGMATESEGNWAERSWLFMSLCRQLGIDVGLVTYSPRNEKEPVIWTCAALIDGKAYLFDARIGMAIPGPDGTGVATIDDALKDPVVLDRLDLPGQSPYGTTRVALLNSPSKVGILMDSSTGYLSGRMRLLQQSLAGNNRTILYRDPADQADKFAQALGARFGGATLWEFPALVETKLFTDSRFVQASLQALVLFDPSLPLLQARMKQLRGEIGEAVTELVDMRKKEKATLADKKTPIPKEVQQALDIYATYYLGLANLDRNDLGLAEPSFKATLAMLPEPGAGLPYFHMYRWGAQTNLARLYEARGDVSLAAQYYSQLDPTSQHHGNLLRARDLIWREPASPLPSPLPAAPPGSPRVAGTASTTGK